MRKRSAARVFHIPLGERTRYGVGLGVSQMGLTRAAKVFANFSTLGATTKAQ